MANKVALVVGSSGITGMNLAVHLTVQKDWEIYGLARNPVSVEGVMNIATDLLDLDGLRTALKDIPVTHVFFCTWLRQDSEAKNCEVNGAMLTNLLDALDNAPLAHVSLVTGGKNYFGSFDEAGSYSVTTPFREEQERKPGLNFYYVQEDILFERAAKKGFKWNVHRPQTVIGYALGNSMNMGVTLAVYATICKETGRPFVFPGSSNQYFGASDMTDAQILAKQLVWAVSNSKAHNQAFNVTNGDVIRWNWMWEKIAEYFGLEVPEYSGQPTPLVVQMKDIDPVWDSIVAKYNLQKNAASVLAPWWHTDADLGRTFESFDDTSKCREFGFLEFKRSDRSFTELFDRLRSEKIIP
jgi:nucleoside-diphosphate-sugar epimerase